MPFCFSPWTNIDISPQGEIAPCCKFKLPTQGPRYTVQNHNIDDYVRSEFLNQVRGQFLKGQWPAGCERCQIEEHNGIASKRNLDHQRWQQHYNNLNLETTDFITASVAFGNTCNLKCITCNSYSSSKWHKEYQEIYGVDCEPVHFYKRDFVDHLAALSKNLIHLDVPGGEPFLSGVHEQKKLLQHYIDLGRADQISLHYTTNATVFPEMHWLDLWRHFKEVDIQLSIDGTESKYEYIRYPGRWSMVLDHVDQYLNLAANQASIRLSVSHTVSAYNVFYIPEFLQWCRTVGLPEPWLGRVHRPAHMRPEVWPNPVREIMQSKLRADCQTISQTWAGVLDRDESQHFEDFKKYTKLHDQKRSLNFGETFVELAGFV